MFTKKYLHVGTYYENHLGTLEIGYLGRHIV